MTLMFRALRRAAVAVCLTAALLPAAAQTASPDALQGLLALRGELAAQAATLVDKARPHDIHLTLVEGADSADLDLTLRQRNGQWVQSVAAVPAWLQGTMQEYRGFHLANRTGGVWRTTLRFDADAGKLELDATRVHGEFGVRFLRDRLLDEHLPPGELTTWWDRFIPIGLSQPRKQDYRLDLRVLPEGAFLDLVLEGGIHWGSAGKKGQPASVVRRPILVRLMVPSNRFSPAWVQTPTWNGGFHEADASKLTFRDGRLQGKLTVLIHHDGWYPWKGTRYHLPATAVYEVDAKLENHHLTGRFTATGDMGEFDGQIRGVGGKPVFGRYNATGQLGQSTGQAFGMLLDHYAPIDRQLTAAPKADASAAEKAAAVNRIVHEIRALQLVVQTGGVLPLDEAMPQTDAARPVWGDDAAGLDAYAALALQWLKKAPDNQRPQAQSDRGGDSPSLGIDAAAVGADGAALLDKSDADAWLYLPQWKLLGPFEQRQGLEHDDAAAAEIIPAYDAAWIQTIDRLGADIASPETVAWQDIAVASDRLSRPKDDAGFFRRFRGEVWYATATVRSETPRTVTLALESQDHAKVWIGGRLVWAGHEKAARYHAMGREFVKVDLPAGDSTILLRVHKDRSPAWIRLAIKPSASANPDVIVEAPAMLDADAGAPPVAWDIDKGINVAWRDTTLGGSSRPLAAGGSVYVTSSPGRITCLGLDDGKPRWTGSTNILEFIDPANAGKWDAADAAGKMALLTPHLKALGLRIREIDDLHVTDPVSDPGNKQVVFHDGAGVAASFDQSGKRLWHIHTRLNKSLVTWVSNRPDAKDLLIIEGDIDLTWPVPKELQPLREGKKPQPMTGLIVLEAVSGKEIARFTLPGDFTPDSSALVRATDTRGASNAMYITATGVIVDLDLARAAASVRGPLLAELPGPNASVYRAGGQAIGPRSGLPYAMTQAGNRLFMTTQEQTIALQVWPAGDGKVGYGHLWQSNYEHTGFTSFVAPSAATEQHLFLTHPVLERGPHCPDARTELHVHDAATGRPLNRLKPALSHAVQHDVTPVIKGGLLYVIDRGGGTHGGHQTHGQVLVCTADERLVPLARNLIDMGTRTSPVFAGGRMILRSGKALTCVAVTTDEGRDYQARVMTRTMLADLGAKPVAAFPIDIEPDRALRPTPEMPVSPLDPGRGTDDWLGAGPFPRIDVEAFRQLPPPSIGTAIAFGGTKAAFTDLSREFACNDAPRYVANYNLQGTGEITPTFSTWLDPRVLSGLDTGYGVFHTVLDNNHDRVVIPRLIDRTVTQILGGQVLEPNIPLHLAPGLYPMTVLVGPDHYKEPEQNIVPPIDVSKALADGKVRDIGWPTTWTVLGLLPPDAKPLTLAQRKAMPEAVQVGERTFKPVEMKALDGTLWLSALAGLREGQAPDVANAPREKAVAANTMAYAFAVIDVPADGWLYITAAADWFMQWTLDGEVIYDVMDTGNGAAPTDVRANPFATPVKKGKHVLSVLVKPGSKGMSLTTLGTFSTASPDDLQAYRVASRMKKSAPDPRITPAFVEVPHPQTRLQRWQRRLTERAGLLRQAAKELEGQAEAQTIQDVLEQAE